MKTILQGLSILWVYQSVVAFVPPPAPPQACGSPMYGIRSFLFGEKAKPSLRIGDIAPDFTAETSQGTLSYHDYLGEQWGLLFSHPADFTPVCTTELGTVQKLQEEWKKRNTKVIALSCDSVEDHKSWIEDIKETQGVSSLDYPIIADPERTIAKMYDMLPATAPNEGMPATVRSVFIIAPNKQIKLMLTYPASTGRNFNELLRVLDSLQLTEYQKLATPANWNAGDKCVVVPAVSTKDAQKMFKNVEVVKPYLRLADANKE